MNTDRAKEIEGRALDILLSSFPNESAFSLPINIGKIAASLDLKLKEGIFKNEEIVGAYDKVSKTIYIAKNDPYQRKAFTIAHEIGHYILHEDKAQETFFRKDLIFVDKETKPMEQEANCFAASLLMPRGVVTRYFALVKDTQYLAELFNVSYSAMRLRLKNLDLIEG